MKGVLMVNLGSPDSTDNEDVRDYLDEFLMDERVIDLPKWFRTFLVKGIILKIRPKKSAEAYRKIWWDDGSPLIVLSEKLKEKVQKKVSIPIQLAMRYGNGEFKKTWCYRDSNYSFISAVCNGNNRNYFDSC